MRRRGLWALDSHMALRHSGVSICPATVPALGAEPRGGTNGNKVMMMMMMIVVLVVVMMM